MDLVPITAFAGCNDLDWNGKQGDQKSTCILDWLADWIHDDAAAWTLQEALTNQFLMGTIRNTFTDHWHAIIGLRCSWQTARSYMNIVGS